MSIKKIQAGWAHGGFYQIFILSVFFSFIAVASVDYIYLRAGRVRLRGWGVKSNFIFLPWGAVGVGGSKQI